MAEIVSTCFYTLLVAALLKDVVSESKASLKGFPCLSLEVLGFGSWNSWNHRLFFCPEKEDFGLVGFYMGKRGIPMWSQWLPSLC
jgi:hypothetical protein